MAITFEEMKSHATASGLKYFVHPERPSIIMGVTGKLSRFQLTVALEVGGQFLQVRSAGLPPCPAAHAHRQAVLLLLATLNYKYRLVKWAWDQADGEVVAYTDLWLGDAKPTPAQFLGILEFFMQNLDTSLVRLERTLQTGVDPGEGGGPPAGTAGTPTVEI